MANKTVFRVHPSINFARIGSSTEFYLSPETSAGLPLDNTATTGGLPIKPGTESEFITSNDLRDAEGLLKRQAARFRLYAYELDGPDTYPCKSPAQEIVVGSRLADGRVVKDIVWTAHIANKKAAAYVVVNSQGVNAYADGKVPQLRNQGVYGDVNSPTRLSQLMIDPGPRAIAASAKTSAHFDKATPASYADANGKIQEQKNYPKYFPTGKLFEPTGKLNTLGEIQTDEKGRLLVLPGFGRTAAQYDEYGDPIPLTGDLNNAGWFDDAGDGPVSATLIFEDESIAPVFGAWVICGDPGFAPQIRNVVSVWDDVFDVWVRELALQPEIYDPKACAFNPDYQPDFETQIRPIFRAANLQRWTTNLPKMALRAHDAVDAISATDNPNRTIMAGLNFIRNPNITAELNIGVPLMPLSVGDAGTSFLTVTKTQYFFLEQWSKSNFVSDKGSGLGAGEMLDMASLSNCLGGRFVPGIEVSYTVRCEDLYMNDWRESGAGPFRVKHKALNYAAATPNTPFLSGGWIPNTTCSTAWNLATSPNSCRFPGKPTTIPAPSTNPASIPWA
ncbi:LodA/GoxA family CTQ-dependent oxidase [Haliscomenobacter sp.]|uniref:LodA/GoxA family CTQ-dependent oxidase n=1 Tax=Haliscomenobacter sp. TaxID=2717303 RepID=UPI003BA9BB6A